MGRDPVAECILEGGPYAKTIWEYGRRYPGRGYGGNFKDWLANEHRLPYGSYGNGSAMRVSAVGFAYTAWDEVCEAAKQSAAVTHNHPEGIKGAQSVAAAIYMARTGCSRDQIREKIASAFGYDLGFTLDDIRATYTFNETCQGSVPQAIVAFLESDTFEDALRRAISIGGDSDTIACITGGIASAFYKGVPQDIRDTVSQKLPDEFIAVLNRFDDRFNPPAPNP